MEISQYILEEAQKMLSQVGTVVLPQQIGVAPEFYLASADDPTVLAFGSLIHGGREYKIGTKKL